MRLSRQPASDRRRFRRVNLAFHGRMLGPDGHERAFRTLDISPGDARLTADKPPFLGDKLIIYAADIGRVEAIVTRHGATDFGVRFAASAAKRERLADALTELCNSETPHLGARRNRRFDGAGGAVVEIEGGGILHCEIVDFSLVGMAVRTAATRPLIGAWVKVGAMHGRVSRYVENGFAIDFDGRKT
jgi:hypothetical protein